MGGNFYALNTAQQEYFTGIKFGEFNQIAVFLNLANLKFGDSVPQMSLKQKNDVTTIT